MCTSTDTFDIFFCFHFRRFTLSGARLQVTEHAEWVGCVSLHFGLRSEMPGTGWGRGLYVVRTEKEGEGPLTVTRIDS